MFEFIILLSAVTAAGAGLLLLRGYARTRTRLLLWSGLCFLGLSANSLMVFVDLDVFPEVSLVPVRNTIALVSLLVLIAGFIWEGGPR